MPRCEMQSASRRSVMRNSRTRLPPAHPLRAQRRANACRCSARSLLQVIHMRTCRAFVDDRRLLPVLRTTCGEGLRAGQVLAGRYRVSREWAAGGMGQLFEGIDQTSKTPVVIKIPRPDDSGQCANCARLAEEGQSAALLEDDHLVRLLHAGTLESGIPFLVMERLEGTDLNAIMKARRAPLPISVAIRYVRQACKGLVAMHGAGLLHRDLKPSNLFLCTRGPRSPSIKVIDFGLVKRLQRRNSDAQLT